MPRKIRQLKHDLRHAGFVEDTKRGKGSHSYWVHPKGPRAELAGHDGDDAQPYQEKQVARAIDEVQRK